MLPCRGAAGIATSRLTGAKKGLAARAELQEPSQHRGRGTHQLTSCPDHTPGSCCLSIMPLLTCSLAQVSDDVAKSVLTEVKEALAAKAESRRSSRREDSRERDKSRDRERHKEHKEKDKDKKRHKKEHKSEKEHKKRCGAFAMFTASPPAAQ